MLNQLSADAGERERLQRMFEQAPGFMALLEGPDHRFTVANRAFHDLVGGRDLVGRAAANAIPEFAGQGFIEILDEAAQTGEPFVGNSMPLKIGREQLFLDVLFQPVTDEAGEPAGIFVQGHNVTEDKRSETIRSAHNRVLELAIGDSPLETTLGELIKIVESTSRTGVLGSILLLDQDGKHLRHGAAPSLPKAYCEAIDGAEIGPSGGSCGTAAYLGQPVFVSDIEHDPLWADFKALALLHDLRACWSTPILTAGGKVLGTFAMYHKEPREPTVRDLALVDLVTQTAALVIDRERAHEALGRIAAMAG
jgi:GAF domain-containing protein